MMQIYLKLILWGSALFIISACGKSLQNMDEKTIDPVLPVEKQELTNKDLSEMNDERFYYTPESKRVVSVKITPWENGRRKLYLYDPRGNITFEHEDVRLSYSISSTIRSFHSNGAAAVLYIHVNPGASMYWHETTIYFSINNEPQWKTELRQPATIEDHMKSKYYWNKTEKIWVRQEYVREQPVP